MSVNNCILTGKEITLKNTGKDFLYYELNIADNNYEVFVCESCKRNIKPGLPNYILSGLIANGKLPKRIVLTTKDCNVNLGSLSNTERIILPEYLQAVNYPNNPAEKLYNFLNILFKLQIIDGGKFRIDLNQEKIWIKSYFQSVEECLFYFNTLRNENLVFADPIRGELYQFDINITFNGLTKVAELSDIGINSKTVFIAMAFDQKTNQYREAIKEAISATGFEWVLIDEVHLESDKTIPDGILAGIKQARFCVADFTLHRNGVYFESGYALGLGKQVIYLCEESQFADAHFDIKQLQHIIYKDAHDLELKLTDKINAWIK